MLFNGPPHPRTLRILLAVFTVLFIGFGAYTGRSVRADGPIVVNSTSDDQTAVTGTCVQSGTICLRNAIATANSNTSATTISFSVSGTITVGSTLVVSNDNTTNPITIDGTGQSIAIDGGSVDSTTGVTVLSISNGGGLTLNNLTIQNGDDIPGAGGGGIVNDGKLVINNSTLSGNISAVNSSTGNGGGIYSTGTLIVTNSTFTGNSSHNGGGIYVNAGSLLISNSTFSGNSASYGAGFMMGFSTPDETVTVSNSTFSNNTAYRGGGLYNANNANPNMLSSIFAGNTLSNVSGSGPDVNSTGVNSLGHNIIGDATGTTWVNATGDQVGDSVTPINPQLGGLASNGGPTQTMAVLAGSPAISGGDCTGNSGVTPNAPAVAKDQTGLTNRHSPCDVGAYEYTGTRATDTPTATATHTPTATHTATKTSTATQTASNTATKTSTSTSTATLTPTNTATATNTATKTNTSTSTATFTPSNTATNTATKTNTSTNTPTFTPSNTSTNTPTNTATKTNTSTSTPTSTPLPARVDSIGVYRAGTFYLRLHNTTGVADLTVGFTAGTRPYPIVGDWTGAGFDTVGVYDKSNGLFTLCTVNTTAGCANVANQKAVVLGIPNDAPLSGRWMSSATNAGVGVFRPSNGLIYLKNGLTSGYADYTMVLGIPSDVGLAGDWNGKGYDSPGVYRPSNSFFYLSNQVTNGSVIGDYQLQYGIGGDAPVAGDWIAQGHDGVGLFRQSNGFTYLKNQLVTGYADNTFTFGIAGDIPVAGHWQLVYPPRPPVPVLIPKTAAPPQPGGSVDNGNVPIGD